MQLLKHWRGEGSRKRPADDSNQDPRPESLRKRARARAWDGNGGQESIQAEIETSTGTGTETAAATHPGTAVREGESERDRERENDQEYRIRGSSNLNKGLFLRTTTSSPSPIQSASLPPPRQPPRSPPPIHPDRRDNFIINLPATAATATATATASATAIASPTLPLAALNKGDSSMSPLSRDLEPVSKVEPEEQNSKPLQSTLHPDLRRDAARTWSSLGPSSPDRASTMTSASDERFHDRPSRDPRRPLGDCYRPSGNPPSRRQSDVMLPPPTKGELERRRSSNLQSQGLLLDNLNAFALSIQTAAGLTVRRDLNKQQAVGQQKERDRQTRFKSTFLTLVEDAESRLEGIEKVSMELEKQIDLSSQAQSKNVMTLATRLLKQAEVSDALPSASDQSRLESDVALIKADLKTMRAEDSYARDRDRDRDHFENDMANLKADLKDVWKGIDHSHRELGTPDELRGKLRGLATKEELQGLVTKDEIQDLITKDDLHRVSDQVRTHVTEVLKSTEEKLASLTSEDANLSQRIKTVEVTTKRSCETADKRDQEYLSRLDHLDASLSDFRKIISHLELTTREQTKDNVVVKADLRTQNEALTELSTYVRSDLSNKTSSLDKSILSNSDEIKSLKQNYEMLNEAIQQVQNLQAASKPEQLQVSTASVIASPGNREEVERIQRDLDALKAKQKDSEPILRDRDALKANQEQIRLIRTDLDSLINEEKLKDESLSQEMEGIGASLSKQSEDLSRLQSEIRSVHELDQQRLQGVEMGLQNQARSLQTLDLFVTSQQQKFDNLTTDTIVQNMVHQMRQMYPTHPGNLIAWLNRIESYLSGSLGERLTKIEKQIDTQNILKAVHEESAETRKICLAKTDSLRQNIDRLNMVAFNFCARGPPDYDKRVDEIVERLTKLEAIYVKAVDDLQKSQMDIVRDLAQLQSRSGIRSIGNTPREATVISRSSKSAEPTGGTTVSCKENNVSDASDTPLSLRINRGVRKNREDWCLSDLNLKRKVAESDGEDKDKEGEARPTSARKVLKRRNVSGRNSFST